MKAIQVTEFGGPEVLELREVPDPVPANGELLLDVSAAGINYADTHQAENSYLAPATLPMIPGAEVVGTGPDGKRVVALLTAGGGYAERAVVDPAYTYAIPDGVSDGAALAVVLQGATAWHMLRTIAHLKPGETVLVHAGSGGVGSLAVQLAKQWGAGRVIATASSEDKRQVALDLGADVAIDSTAEDLEAAIKEAAGGRVDIVLEMVGGDCFTASLKSLAPFGRLVIYGIAGRVPPPPVDAARLLRGSKGVLGFWLAHAFLKPEMLREAIEDLLGMVERGELKTVVGGTYPLADARQAHEDIRSRKTSGKLVLDTKK
ncbi:MAG: zinc-binding dehydrogenase [Candidatus Dormiibacterota bacterium]